MASSAPTTTNQPAPGMTKQTLRIRKDLEALQTDPLPFAKNLELNLVDNLNELKGVLIGPDGTGYANTEYTFLIRYPAQYPFKAPEFYFTTTIQHPNIDARTGTTCHEKLLETWAPSITLGKLLTEMHSLLRTPNYDSPIEAGAAEPKTSGDAK